MAIIKYNLEDWNGFTDVAYCDTFLTENVIGSQRTLYDALSISDKEIYIKQATILINSKIELPDTLEDNLQNATCYLVNYSIGVDMLNADADTNLKKLVIDKSTIEKEFFSQGRGANAFPPIVEMLLKDYGYVTGGSFAFARG